VAFVCSSAEAAVAASLDVGGNGSITCHSLVTGVERQLPVPPNSKFRLVADIQKSAKQ
jgi:hypothetical protein